MLSPFNYTNIKYIYKLYYYRFIDPYKPNHYNLINKLYSYESIGKDYLNKYPTSSVWINENENLFINQPSARDDYMNASEIQEKIKKSIINDIDIISKKNKNYNISKDEFQTFYIKSNYHIEQNIDGIIDELKNDIIMNDIK
jgi:hypothetical protein